MARSEFVDIMRRGKAYKTPSFVVLAVKSARSESRIGASVSKKNGNAVARNKIKRQIRAMIALEWNFETPFDLVIIAKSAYDVGRFAENHAELSEVLRKLEKNIEETN